MKPLFTLFAFSFAVLSVSAQSFQFTSLEKTPWSDINSPVVARASVKNLSASDKNVKVRRFEQSLVSGSVNYFCWDVCYGPSTSISVNALTIPANDTVDVFYADYEPNGNAGVSSVQYCFYDQQNQSDSICFIAYFTASPTGIQTDFFTDENKITTAYPNPSSEKTKIAYSVKNDAGTAVLVFHNMLGALVKTVELKEKLATAEISVSDFKPGIYFYSLVVDNKTVATKKLVVSR